MLRNYFAAAIRSLFRDRAYAAVNICGLALGFFAVLLIALYARDELSYDHQLPESDRTYRMFVQADAGKPVSIAVTTANLAGALELDFPEVEFATRLVPGGGTLRQRDVEVRSLIYWADPDFFRMFPPKVVAGDAQAALNRPDALVVTRRFARQLFGREDVIGKAVQLNRQETLTIAAVIETLPSNTHFSFDVIAPGVASFSPLTRFDALAGRTDIIQPENVYTYVRLRPGADVGRLNADMSRFAQRHVAGDIDGTPSWKRYKFTLVSLPELHFLPPSIADMKAPGDRRTLHGLIVIGVLILFVAGSNFVSMMTARAARRAVEVGVRKSVGATRRQIIVQFLGECLFYAGLALGIAMIAVELVLPGFNGFLQREITFDYVRDPALGAAIAGAWLMVGLAAGAYPSLVLSMFRPATVLKGAFSLPGGRGRLRHALVVLQFGTLVALIVSTTTIYQQTRFAIEDQLRVAGDQVYLVNFACTAGFRDVAAQLPGVREASCVSGSALSRDRFGMQFALQNGGTFNVRGAMVDASFFRLFGVQPIAGRLLDEQHGEDNLAAREPDTTSNPSIIVNESGARALGYANPADAVGQLRRWSRITIRNNDLKIMDAASSEIVGVVPDFSVGSIRRAIEPTAYFIDPPMTFVLVTKLDGNAIPQALRGIQEQWAKSTDGRPFNGQFLSQILNDLYADIQRQTRLFAAFSGVAIVVASLGLLGLAVFTAERRTREIGLRKVMGASRADILRFIGWQFARPVLFANLIAWPAAWFFMRRWLEGFAYHVDLQPLVFLAASVLALGIALVTVSGHALLVARARPAEALRYE